MSSNMSYANVAPGATGVSPDHPASSGYKLEIVDGPGGVVRSAGWPARKKIAICGFAASSRNLAPFDDPECEIWGLNQLYRHVPRATRWFDIHANWREDNVEGTDHPRWLAECGIPVYMSFYEPSIPTCVRYPVERVIERVTGVDYFTSTVAYMVALAIEEIDTQIEGEADILEVDAQWDRPVTNEERADTARGILQSPRAFRKWFADRYAEREIGLFGIDLIVGKEYDFQKACVEFLLGLAQARNITLRLPPQCALLKQMWRYGYESEPAQGPLKVSELRRRATKLVEDRNKLIAQLQTVDGALQENGYWSDVGELRLRGGAVRLNEATSSD